MKHKYNIEHLLQSIIGYKGLPYPGAFFPNRPASSYTGDNFDIPTSPAPQQELVKGTRLYKKDALGRWYFMPVFIRHQDIRGEDHTLELENAVISITGTKNIVRTPLVGRRGSVKELISIGDYKISIAAFIRSSDGSYPEAQITRMKDLYNINESVYSDMQNIWDTYRKKSKMNLIVSGSIYSLMQKIFQNNKEPLFGRADNIIKLSAFDLNTLKEIMRDYNPSYTNDDLLALYTFTGGVPKYVELFCDNITLNIDEMISFMVRENSPFTDEGKNLLIEEFGKNYATYFSILSAISGGVNTQPEIETALGDKSIGGQIKRLIEDYNIIVRQRPILAKEGSQAVRYEIQDNFIRFWFNYFDRYRSLIEIKNFIGLQAIIKSDYPTYSGIMLERYFKQQFAESFQYRAIGSWWEPKGNQNEIDIVALKLEKNQAVAAEVKRQKKNFKPEFLAAKVEHLKNKLLPKYQIDRVYLSLEDM